MKAFHVLKDKATPIKYTEDYLKKQDCYEIVNNVRILNPALMSKPEKQQYEKKSKYFTKNLRPFGGALKYDSQMFQKHIAAFKVKMQNRSMEHAARSRPMSSFGSRNAFGTRPGSAMKKHQAKNYS